MKHLYIDISQLVFWQGKLTGIPRVMNELTIRYASSEGTICHFVVWEHGSRSFYEIDVHASLETRGKRVHYAPRKDHEVGMRKHYIVAEAAIGHQAGRVLRRLQTYHIRGTQKILNLIYARTRKKVSITPSDTLFVLWGEWADKNYIAKLTQLREQGTSLIQIMYDVLPLVAPQYSGHSTKSMDMYNRAILPLCNLVLVISECTKRDLVQWLTDVKLKVPPIEVFRLGDDFQMTAPQRPKGAFAQSGLKGEDYILCVGTVEARKNHTLLYYVYKLAAQRDVELPKLVVVGRRGWLTDNIYDMITLDPQTRDKIVFLTNASDDELSWLYEHCLFSIYPSFYEGWGLPVAESIAHGVPVITSNTSSIPEIAGDIINYFSPTSTDECLAAITSLLSPAERERARKKLSKYQPTTWEQTFKQVDNHVKEIYGK
jgi:glycosyltransferase involved in cell wall biosynthesis